jgi:hypothetical protein
LQLTSAVVPIQLRVLLDRSKDRVAQEVGYKSWKDLWMALRTNHKAKMTLEEEMGIADKLVEKFKDKTPGLSPDTLRYLCSKTSGARTQGKTAAHQATEKEIKAAIATHSTDSEEHAYLLDLYQFLFNYENTPIN